jgi:hypothetical protein
MIRPFLSIWTTSRRSNLLLNSSSLSQRLLILSGNSNKQIKMQYRYVTFGWNRLSLVTYNFVGGMVPPAAAAARTTGTAASTTTAASATGGMA